MGHPSYMQQNQLEVAEDVQYSNFNIKVLLSRFMRLQSQNFKFVNAHCLCEDFYFKVFMCYLNYSSVSRPARKLSVSRQSACDIGQQVFFRKQEKQGFKRVFAMSEVLACVNKKACYERLQATLSAAWMKINETAVSHLLQVILKSGISNLVTCPPIEAKLKKSTFSLQRLTNFTPTNNMKNKTSNL